MNLLLVLPDLKKALEKASHECHHSLLTPADRVNSNTSNRLAYLTVLCAAKIQVYHDIIYIMYAYYFPCNDAVLHLLS